jgi:hypothetical protein
MSNIVSGCWITTHYPRFFNVLEGPIRSKASHDFVGAKVMARTPLEERLEILEERKRQLEEQTRTLRARLTSEKRKQDTRKRIMLGSFLLHRLEQERPESPVLRDLLQRELPGFLTRDRDRELLAELLTDCGLEGR